MSTFGPMGSGGWSAAIAAIELLALTGMAVAVLVRRRRRRRYRVMAASSNHPAVRGRRLIEESAIVRDRLSGRIDAHTYRVLMFDLVSHQQFSPRRGLDVER
ncbi:MAG: hypothetical protein P4L86_15805 [Mycobacterium sp.]|nr:hypothetical protein [Mycobacterium sp.]